MERDFNHITSLKPGDKVQGHFQVDGEDRYDRQRAGELNPGDFWFYVQKTAPGLLETGGLLYICPCGCNRIGSLQFDLPFATKERPKWSWDRSYESPTLQPSILSDPKKGGCGWHGYLTKGVWITSSIEPKPEKSS